ncbi:hypothetical protein ACFV16_22195 [Streptomyces massasporeus]|uniref:hypothetical protein n=1 Tax=Streptomyces massasporeus TaxID=67324 RepID=UPI003697DB8D
MITDPERYRFAADSMHGISTVAIICTTCSGGDEEAAVPVQVFDYLFPSIGDVQKIIDEHENDVHGVSAEVLRLAAVLVTEGPRHGSPSMLQRRLRQGHGVAVSFDESLAILARLQEAGVVGPVDPHKHSHPVLLDRAEALTALEVTT